MRFVPLLSGFLVSNSMRVIVSERVLNGGCVREWQSLPRETAFFLLFFFIVKRSAVDRRLTKYFDNHQHRRRHNSNNNNNSNNK